MSNTKKPKTSGLGDIKTRMDNIAKKDDVRQESLRLDSILEKLQTANDELKATIKDTESLITELKTLDRSVRGLVSDVLSYLNTIKEQLSSIKAIQFKAQIDDQSISQLEKTQKEAVDGFKSTLFELLRRTNLTLDQFESGLWNVLKERGIWLSPGSLRWIYPSIGVCVVYTVLKFGFWIARLITQGV